MSLEAGFNRYRLVERISLGAFGALWRAADRVPGKEVAVRLVSPPRVSDEAIAAFESEMTVAMALRHPSLARVLEVGRSADGGAWAATEFVVGDSLERVLADEGPPSAATALRLFSDVASALGELHRHDLVHGSLSPRAVIIQRSKSGALKPKVIGLGRARLAPAQAKNAPPPEGAYSSPEVVAARQYSAASDVWALGVLLFHCVVGRPPFAARSPSSFYAETRGVQRILDTIDDEVVRGLIEQCLAPAANDRPAIAALIKQAELAGWIEQSDAVEASPPIEPTPEPVEAQPAAVEEPKPVAQREPVVQQPVPVADVPDDVDFRPRRGGKKLVVGVIAATVAALSVFVATREPRPRPQAKAPIVAETTTAAIATTTEPSVVAPPPPPPKPTVAEPPPKPQPVAANAKPPAPKPADNDNPYE